jgi:putative endonuclease
MKYYTYIIRSLKDKNFYVGHTSKDPKERLKEHSWKSVFSTKHRVPFEFIHAEEFKSRAEAIKEERLFKSKKRGAWRSLASALEWGSRGRRFESDRPDFIRQV